ncbi:hypothetical protein [Sphingomonas sp.]|uniref:hypothetical protein n=1 Tax=Sphingomonas sp. TaxID=28214 RepID=UPI003AFFABC2
MAMAWARAVGRAAPIMVVRGLLFRPVAPVIRPAAIEAAGVAAVTGAAAGIGLSGTSMAVPAIRVRVTALTVGTGIGLAISLVRAGAAGTPHPIARASSAM